MGSRRATDGVGEAVGEEQACARALLRPTKGEPGRESLRACCQPFNTCSQALTQIKLSDLKKPTVPEHSG